MVNQEAERFDAIIIGSGQAGNPLAGALGKAGWKVALIERKHVGGTCINEGCTPTKTMVASARVAYLARRGEDYGVKTGPVSVDLEVVRKRKDDIVQSFRSGSKSKLEANEHIALIAGEGSFLDAKTVKIQMADNNTRLLTADKIILNTGGRPRIPTIKGLAREDLLNSTEIMELTEVPGHLVVLGGGYIGLEFGQMFRRFGSKVTIIQHSSQLVPREDEDVAKEMAKILREDGIDLWLNASIEEGGRTEEGLELTIAQQDHRETLHATHLLVAIGREPNTETLNLSAAGIEPDKHGYVPVNKFLETEVAGIYAVGDVKGPPFFTHISYDDYRILKSAFLEDQKPSTEDRPVPYTVFTDPQLGRIGLSEKEARESGRRIKVAKIPMTWVARALEMDETRGLMKAIVDAESEEILGVAILGIEGGEIMTALQLAMMGKLRYPQLRDGIFAHPLLAESFNTLFGSVE
ncbi:FAD-dependent pyridine nucleotide-disulfide oxidoreductase [Planctomycetales bacterium 10988]|nr:FAD-dependent pyridine nucleotide-disulfide oxidoreductase [Planctomycetales bacterium 10988]